MAAVSAGAVAGPWAGAPARPCAPSPYPPTIPMRTSPKPKPLNVKRRPIFGLHSRNQRSVVNARVRNLLRELSQKPVITAAKKLLGIAVERFGDSTGTVELRRRVAIRSSGGVSEQQARSVADLV